MKLQYSGRCNQLQLCALAKICADYLEPNTVIYVKGELGAGKTTFCRALIQALGFSGSIQSPTYTWMQVYEFAENLVIHMDLYLAKQKNISTEMLLADYLDCNPLILIEWPELVADLPQADLSISLQGTGAVRDFIITADSSSTEHIISKLKAEDVV